MATLVVLSEGKETAYELKEGQNLIGRLADCPIPIGHATTSGRHAVIHAQGGEFFLEDIGSRNGTFVNQQRIEGRVKLSHNDAIRYGDAPFGFTSEFASTTRHDQIEPRGSSRLGTGPELPPRIRSAMV